MRKGKKTPVVTETDADEAGQTAQAIDDSGPAAESPLDQPAARGADAPSSDAAKDASGALAEPSTMTEAREETVESLGAQVAELKDKLLRAKAEFANLQRRTATERLEAIRFANADLVRPLLNVIDDFERSLAHDVETDDAKGVLTGVRLVYENLMKVLYDHGLALIEAVGKPFDPNFHEAAMRQPTSQQPPGTVLQEVSKGYQLRDRVIRPTKVIVAAEPPREQAKPEADAASEQESSKEL